MIIIQSTEEGEQLLEQMTGSCKVNQLLKWLEVRGFQEKDLTDGSITIGLQSSLVSAEAKAALQILSSIQFIQEREATGELEEESV